MYQQQTAYPVQQGQVAYPQQQQQQQVVVQGQPGPTVVVAGPGPTKYENYAASQAIGLGWTQIAVGILCFIFQIVAIAIFAGAESSYVGAGIWCGLFFILTGAFGVVSGKNKTQCPIVAFLVLSIITTSIFSLTLLSLAAAGLGIDNDEYYYYHRYREYGYPGGSGSGSGYFDNYGRYVSGSGYPYYYNPNREAKLAINSILLILAFIELVVAIWSSVVCCAGICCRRTATQGVVFPAQVQYVQNPAQGQQVVMITQTNPQYTQPQAGFVQVQGYPQPQAGYPNQQAMGPPPYQQVAPGTTQGQTNPAFTPTGQPDNTYQQLNPAPSNPNPPPPNNPDLYPTKN